MSAPDFAAILNAVDALHVRWDDCPYADEPEPLCRDCQMVWPCNTHRLLHPEPCQTCHGTRHVATRLYSDGVPMTEAPCPVCASAVQP